MSYLLLREISLPSTTVHDIWSLSWTFLLLQQELPLLLQQSCGHNHIYILVCIYLSNYLGLPQWLRDKELVSGAGASGDLGSIPGLERSPGGGHSNTLQDPRLENTTDRGAWQARVSKSQTHWSALAHTRAQAVVWLASLSPIGWALWGHELGMSCLELFCPCLVKCLAQILNCCRVL